MRSNTVEFTKIIGYYESHCEAVEVARGIGWESSFIIWPTYNPVSGSGRTTWLVAQTRFAFGK